MDQELFGIVYFRVIFNTQNLQYDNRILQKQFIDYNLSKVVCVIELSKCIIFYKTIKNIAV